MNFPFFKQLDSVDCGPACLKMIAKFHGKNYSLDYLRNLCFINKEGVSLQALSHAAEYVGYSTMKLKMNLDRLIDDAPLPAILYWDNNHYVVLFGFKKNSKGVITQLSIADPKRSIIRLRKKEFLTHWLSTESDQMGIVLLLEPNEDFIEKVESHGIEKKSESDYKFILKYIIKYKLYFFQLLLGIVTASILSLIFPFLTQNIVDIGIGTKDISFVSLVLIAQLVLILSGTCLDFIRRQLQLHISARINISIISDFLLKLMRLPIRFFDSKNIGDIITRINDQKRIESFITSSVLNTVLLFCNFIVLTFLLFYYNKIILTIFLCGTILSFIWVLFFMKKRREIDYRLFKSATQNTEKIYEIVNGMQEIKLNGFETYKQNEWQENQVELFRINLANTKLEQFQQIGSIFFTQLKNILVTFISAKAVINGDLSLGMMMSVNMIVGQMNNPVEEFIGFFKSYQFAKISLERMNEVYRKPDEEDTISNELSSKTLDNLKSIKFENVSFQYEGPSSPFIFNNLSVEIPIGKTTAIVGTSGSGKTTLLKLILKFYEPLSGNIYIDGVNLRSISPRLWREQCGIVMQEGYIFSDSIERNIVTSDDNPDLNKLVQSARVACIEDFINDSPFQFKTKVGTSGSGLSTGQKQRILIARAIYKNPDYFFFDEATSSLDANNEKMIVDNLENMLHNKTAIIIAHRLSTVKNADQIIVLDNGKIVETGNHTTLSALKGYYYKLIKNQLELGN